MESLKKLHYIWIGFDYMIEKSKKYIKIYSFRLLVIIIFFITSSNVVAQDYIFRQLKVGDGLSQSTIFASMQDSKGFMWFATRNGLNRYDGYKFVVYINDPKDSTSISDDGISALFEDKNGILWIGTIYGNLNKFNSDTDTFIYNNIFSSLKTIPDQSNGFYEYPIAFSRNLSSTITSITEDKDGTLWIGTWGKGIVNLDKNFNVINHIYSDANNPIGLKTNRIMDLHFDAEGRLWVATFGGGLTRISKTKNNSKDDFTYENVMRGIDEYSLSDDKLLRLFEDSDRNIWIGSFYGGLIFIAETESKKPFGKAKINCQRCPLTDNKLSKNTVISFTEDKDNHIWIGTFGGGLIRLNYHTNESLHFFNDPLNENSLGDNDVLSLSIDRSGIIWAGSHLGAGITKIQVNKTKFHHIKHDASNQNSLNDDVVWAIYKDDKDILWIGTYKGGINIYNPSTKEFSFIKNTGSRNSLSSNHIRAIREDSFGNLWIGTYDGGLNILNKHTKEIKIYKNDPSDENSISANQVQDIMIEYDSVYWIGTFGGGLNKVIVQGNPINQKLKFNNFKFDANNPNTISDNRIYKLYKTKDGLFWIGTYGGGLNMFNPRTGKFKRFPINSEKKEKYNLENLMSIIEDSDGSLWLGSYGGSLTSFDRKTEKFKRFPIENGLTSGVVYGMIEDDDKNLWISSDNGIFKLNIKTKEIKRYDIQDGLQSLEFSGGAYFKDNNGELYFGGINGLNFFNPPEIKSNNYIPPIVITLVKVFNEPYYGDQKEIILDYKKNFISFEFSSLDYSDPLDNQYSYILEGLQSEWQITDASARMASYTNLSPGTYIFKVKGSNSDGVWSENFASIKIVIVGPFWKTWWFITLLIILIAAFLYFLSTIRIKNLLAIEKLKSKLAADLHDNIGSGLTEISILSEVASRKNNNDQRITGNELNTISDISRQLVDNMSDIVWVVNPSRDSLHDLILRLKDSYSELLNSMGISFKAKHLEKLRDIKLPMDVKQNLYLIFKEAINNSIKHSYCKHIILDANLRNDVLEISLTDDGSGFDENRTNSGNGLKNMVNRAFQIGGRIKIKSSVNNGTSIRFIGKLGRINKIKLFFKND